MARRSSSSKTDAVIEASSLPRIARERLLVAVTTHIDHELACAEQYGVGAEIQTFSFPNWLNRDFKDELARIAERVAALHGPIGCHGAFLDTTHHSQDAEVRNVARKRYLQSLDVADALGASYVLFHSQYNPIIRVPAYPEAYRTESLKFWPGIIAEAERKNIRIYIENMFDDSPEPALRVIDEIDSPFFRACLDIAHAAVWSELPLSEWVDALKPRLSHIHINDCSGKQDDHFGLGQGELDIPEAFRIIEGTGLPLTYALETGTKTEASLKYLGLDVL